MNCHTLGRCARGLVACNQRNLTIEQATSFRKPESIYSGKLTGYTQKKVVRQVSAGGTLTIVSASTRRAVVRVRKFARLAYPLWHQMFRPTALGLGGLAITVALWGFGYKISLYYHHPTAAQRATIAKLWVEPPNASLIAVQRLKNQLHLVASPQALCNTFSWLPRLGRAPVCIFPVYRGSVLSFDLPSPLRSPPPEDFHTA